MVQFLGQSGGFISLVLGLLESFSSKSILHQVYQAVHLQKIFIKSHDRKEKVNMAELCRIWTFDHLISRLKLYHETTDLCCKWDVKIKNDKYRSLTFYEDFWKMNLLKAEFPTSGSFSLLQHEKLCIYKRYFFLNH